MVQVNSAIQENSISIVFTAVELRQIDEALTALETILIPKLIQLQPSESRRFGTLCSVTKNWTDMVHTDALQIPALAPAFIDFNGWNKDDAARQALNPRFTRIEALFRNMRDTNRVICFDIYNTCLAVYSNVKYLASQNIPGISAFYDKWKMQFPRTGTGGKGNGSSNS